MQVQPAMNAGAAVIQHRAFTLLTLLLPCMVPGVQIFSNVPALIKQRSGEPARRAGPGRVYVGCSYSSAQWAWSAALPRAGTQQMRHHPPRDFLRRLRTASVGLRRGCKGG
jgi:hypothetical protein